ncbi:MAG: hypothetical protein WBA99_18135, partial [Nodosilinea sp.]
PLLLESLDTVSFKVPIAPDRACFFTGKTAVYVGVDAAFDDGVGHYLVKGVPAAICDKTAKNLSEHADVLITPSTWHYSGGGCC